MLNNRYRRGGAPRRTVTLIAAVSAGLLIAAGAFVLNRAKESEKAVKPAKDPNWDKTHEKLFLAEQLKKNPTHGPILLRMAVIEREEGNLKGAREHLEKGVAADGSQVDLRLELGLVDSELGDIAAAEEQNRAVLKIDPNQPDALYNVGAICANRRDFQQARQLWTQAVQTGAKTDSGIKAQAALKRLETMR